MKRKKKICSGGKKKKKTLPNRLFFSIIKVVEKL